MAITFGVFVPQGWRMDLIGIENPVDQFEAMTAVAREGRNYDEIVKSTSYSFFPVDAGADPVQATARVREGYGGMDFDTFTSKVAPVKTTDEIAEAVQTGAGYAITCIPGLAYDLDPLHRYEEGVVNKLAE